MDFRIGLCSHRRILQPIEPAVATVLRKPDARTESHWHHFDRGVLTHPHDLSIDDWISYCQRTGSLYVNRLRLICLKDGELIEIDSRTSDALALAVRFKCPIFTYEFILDAAGVVIDENEEGATVESEVKKPAPKYGSLSSYSVEDLSQLLDEVLAEENYERAAEIRDEINRRKDKS